MQTETSYLQLSLIILTTLWKVDTIQKVFTRRLIAEPRVPNDISEHGAETGENPNISSVTAGNTSVPSVDQVTLTDDSIDYSLQISKNYKLGDVSKNAVYGHAITPQHGLTVLRI